MAAGLLLAATVALGAPARSAAAAPMPTCVDAPCVAITTVSSTGQAVEYLQATDVDGTNDTPYVLGKGGSFACDPLLKIDSALDEVDSKDGGAAAVHYVTITGGGSSTPSVLDHDDAQPTADFDDGGHLPAVCKVGSGSDAQLTYIRPIRTPTDNNAQDQQFGGEGNLDITAHEVGQLLTASIRTSPTNPRVGEKVTFSSTITPVAPGVSWHWDFDDGGYGVRGDAPSTPTGTTTHVYTHAGSWYPQVTVSGNDNYAPPVSVHLTVGRAATPKKAKTTAPGGGKGGKNNPSNGPTTGAGAPNGLVGATTGRGHGATGTAGGLSGPAAGSTTAGTGSASLSVPGSSGSAQPVHEDGLVTVRGFALTLPSTARSQAAAASASGRAPSALEARRATTADQVNAALVGCLVVLLLLGLGVFAETRPPGGRGRRRGHRT